MAEHYRSLLSKHIRKLQHEHAEWAQHNFGSRPVFYPFLGMIEEVGELCHSELKMRQKIRGTEAEHRKAIRDALADIVIYLIDYCTLGKIDLALIIDNEPLIFEPTAIDTALTAIPKALSKIVIAYPLINSTPVLELVRAIDEYAALLGYSMNQILDETWQRVSKRDWKGDPRSGGEKTAKNPQLNAMCDSGQHVLERGSTHRKNRCCECHVELEFTGERWVPKWSADRQKYEFDHEDCQKPLSTFYNAHLDTSIQSAVNIYPTAVGILESVIEIQKERGRLYGDGEEQERNMQNIVEAFASMTGVELTETQGWLFMVALKGVRAGHGGKVDDFKDGTSYFSLAGESRGRNKK